MLPCYLLYQLLKPAGIQFIGATTGGAQEVSTAMRVIGMRTDDVAVCRLQAVHKPYSYQEIKMPIDRQWRNFLFVPLLQPGNELIGGNRSITRQHFGVSRQTRGCQALTHLNAARFGELSPFFGDLWRLGQLLAQLNALRIR